MAGLTTEQLMQMNAIIGTSTSLNYSVPNPGVGEPVNKATTLTTRPVHTVPVDSYGQPIVAPSHAFPHIDSPTTLDLRAMHGDRVDDASRVSSTNAASAGKTNRGDYSGYSVEPADYPGVVGPTDMVMPQSRSTQSNISKYGHIGYPSTKSKYSSIADVLGVTLASTPLPRRRPATANYGPNGAPVTRGDPMWEQLDTPGYRPAQPGSAFVRKIPQANLRGVTLSSLPTTVVLGYTPASSPQFQSYRDTGSVADRNWGISGEGSYGGPRSLV